jgi:hypothetical protein
MSPKTTVGPVSRIVIIVVASLAAIAFLIYSLSRPPSRPETDERPFGAPVPARSESTPGR